jgi:hypothetical protein
MPRPRKEREMKIVNQLSVGLMDAEADAVKAISDFACISPSQYGRMAIKRQLIADGMLKHPGAANEVKS